MEKTSVGNIHHNGFMEFDLWGTSAGPAETHSIVVFELEKTSTPFSLL
jgi:hypothetical protein